MLHARTLARVAVVCVAVAAMGCLPVPAYRPSVRAIVVEAESGEPLAGAEVGVRVGGGQGGFHGSGSSLFFGEYRSDAQGRLWMPGKAYVRLLSPMRWLAVEKGAIWLEPEFELRHPRLDQFIWFYECSVTGDALSGYTIEVRRSWRGEAWEPAPARRPSRCSVWRPRRRSTPGVAGD